MKYNFILLTGLIVISAISCDPAKRYDKEQEEQIENYLLENSDVVFEKKESGLYYTDILMGAGNQATQFDTAYVFYTGKYLNGTVFDTNVGKTDTLIFPVLGGYLIPGFDEAISYMKVGGKCRIIVPSSLGYGNTGYYFPAFTPTLFDIQLVKLLEGPSR